MIPTSLTPRLHLAGTLSFAGLRHAPDQGRVAAHGGRGLRAVGSGGRGASPGGRLRVHGVGDLLRPQLRPHLRNVRAARALLPREGFVLPRPGLAAAPGLQWRVSGRLLRACRPVAISNWLAL